MALSTHRVCIPEKGKPLPKINPCPGGCAPGRCFNVRCPHRIRLKFPNDKAFISKEDKFQEMCFEKAMKEQQKKERLEFMKKERKFMGMKEPNEKDKKPSLYEKDVEGSKQTDYGSCPPIDFSKLKAPEGSKCMRPPARPLCMLEVPPITPPTDDYTELSRFLRVSTMPGYSHNDTVSEYRDNHNMAVFSNRKDVNKQVYKMKRDWLSVWGESNVIEQRWKKAWVEKYGGGAGK